MTGRCAKGWAGAVVGTLAVCLATTGCVSIDQTLYLHGVDAESGLAVPAVFLTDTTEADRAVGSVRISRSTCGEVTGRMPITGPQPPDEILKTYPAENLRWTFPRTSLGVDLQVPFSRSFGMEGGVQASFSSAETFWGGYAGLALFGGGRKVAVRLSGGIRVSSVRVRAPSVLVQRTSGPFTDPKEEVRFFLDSLHISPLDWYVTLTLNTSQAEWPLNVFVQGAMVRQALARFSPRTTVYPLFVVMYSVTDARLDFTATTWSITPGVSVRVSESMRILAGGRLLVHDIEGGRPSSFWMPFVQADIFF